jgi:hypothetical protein
MIEWVLKALKHSGMSQAELTRVLARDHGWADNRSILNKILTGERTLKAEEMFDISKATGYPIPDGGAQGLVKEPEPGLRRVVVAAHVQAGDWAETWEWDEQEQYSVYVPDVPALKQFRLYGAEARGLSMNKRYPEGTVLVFNDVQETMESPVPGKRYIVERRRSSGEREHTVKLLVSDAAGKLWLMPESDQPEFQSAISVENGTGDGDMVIILGRVEFAVLRE